jgi:two-component system response regulator RegX3
MEVLVVEDDESYREALELILAREGFAVTLAKDGQEGLRLFTERRPDLVLLDVLMPGLPGTEVFRRMRAMSSVPVIIVSALDAEVDVVVGLELGAADYVVKPYRARELVARIQAVLRRSPAAPETTVPGATARSSAGAVSAVRSQEPGEVAPTPEVIEADEVRVDLARRVVSLAGKAVSTTRREFDLLALLLSPPGRVRTREELIDKLWSGSDLADTRTLDTHVRRLRVKLERDPAGPRHIVTVRGVGFRFDAEGLTPGPDRPSE